MKTTIFAIIVYFMFLIGSVFMISNHAKADMYRWHQTGNINTDDDHKYDYLFHKYRIPVILCITDNQCDQDIIDSDNISELECNSYKWQTVQKFVQEHGYDHWFKIGECYR